MVQRLNHLVYTAAWELSRVDDKIQICIPMSPKDLEATYWEYRFPNEIQISTTETHVVCLVDNLAAMRILLENNEKALEKIHSLGIEWKVEKQSATNLLEVHSALKKAYDTWGRYLIEDGFFKMHSKDAKRRSFRETYFFDSKYTEKQLRILENSVMFEDSMGIPTLNLVYGVAIQMRRSSWTAFSPDIKILNRFLHNSIEEE